MRLLVAAVAVLFALPGTAVASSTVSTDGSSGYSLTDNSGNDNTYKLYKSKRSGNWIFYDKTGGKVRIGGQHGNCFDANDIGDPDGSYLGVSCPPRTFVRINLANGKDETDPTVNDADALFDGRLIIDGGAGNDTLRGTHLDDELHGGPDNDHLHPRLGSDVVDGGDNLDTDHNEERQQDLIINQNDFADDGAVGTDERDDVKASTEIVIGGMQNDILVGADGPPSDPGIAVPALVGWAGKDLIIPGTRSENLIAGGFGVAASEGDTLSYSGRTAPVRVVLDGRENDGTSAPNNLSVEKDNVTNGFTRILLGRAGDEYIGPHAGAVPDQELSPYETNAQRIEILAGAGDDKLFPGSSAEDLYGQNDTDLVSYIRRGPTSGLMHVSMTMDGKPNDGQAVSIPGLTNQLITYVVVPLMTAGPFGPTRRITLEYGDDGVSATLTLFNEGEITSRVLMNWNKVRTTLFSWLFGQPIEYQSVEAAQAVLNVRSMAQTSGAQMSPDLLDDLAGIAAAMERKATDATLQGIMFGWPAPFSSHGLTTEADNIASDNEQLQGSTNTAPQDSGGGVPFDYIEGNDFSNTVLGSPGPDVVDGKGGIDVINGDTPGNGADDVLLGGPHPDWLIGNNGADVLVGGPGRDAIFANDASSPGDGAIDSLFCGEGSLTQPFDFGPVENDVLLLSDADGDRRSQLCRGIGGTADAVGATVGKSGSVLSVRATPEKRNGLKLAMSGSRILVTDTINPVVARSGCEEIAGRDDQVSCSTAGISKIAVESGDLRDTVDLSGLRSSAEIEADTGEGNDQVTGSPGAETIATGPGRDKIKAKDGDDTLQGGEGADVLDAGTGSDTISYADKTGPTDIYLAQPATKGNGDTTQTPGTYDPNLRAQRSLEGDTIKWAESAIGGSGTDIIQGNQLDNILTGGPGSDYLSAGAGNDTLKDKDGDQDKQALCGDGQDTAILDSFDTIDPLRSSCERLL